MRFDANRMGAALGFPGIDPRNWIVLAVVEAIRVDANGAKADVVLLHDERTETVAIGGAVGSGHGLYVPVQVGQLVIVVLPLGSTDAGGVIVGAAWDRGQAPPATVLDNPDDTALVGADGRAVRVLAQGGAAVLAGDNVDLGDEGATLGVARLGDTVTVTMPIGSILIPNPPTFVPPMIPNPAPYPVSGTITGASSKVRAT